MKLFKIILSMTPHINNTTVVIIIDVYYIIKQSSLWFPVMVTILLIAEWYFVIKSYKSTQEFKRKWDK